MGDVTSVSMEGEDANRIGCCDDVGNFENLFFFSSPLSFLSSLSFSRWVVRDAMDEARLVKVEAEGDGVAEPSGGAMAELRIKREVRVLQNSWTWQFDEITVTVSAMSFCVAAQRN